MDVSPGAQLAIINNEFFHSARLMWSCLGFQELNFNVNYTCCLPLYASMILLYVPVHIGTFSRPILHSICVFC